MLRVTALKDLRELDALGAEWDAIDEGSSPRTPFTSRLWNTLWWERMHEERALLRDRFFAHAVRDAAGKLVAVAPMMITHRPAVGPVRVRVLQFFGTDNYVTELRGVVCAPADEARVVAALRAHLEGHAREWDWLEWAGVRNDGEAHAALSRDAQVTWGRTTPVFWLPLPESWEAFKTALPRNIKESLRKCYNSLKRDGHAFTIRVARSADEAGPAIETFLQLHASRAAVQGTIEHDDVFASERARDFLRAYAQRMAEDDRLRVFQLDIGGKTVATRVGFLLGKELYLYFSGYDYEWGKYNVMTTVVAESIKWAIESGLPLVHLSTGNDVSKTRWRPSTYDTQQGIQLSPTWRGPLAFRAYRRVVDQPAGSPLARVVAFARRQG